MVMQDRKKPKINLSILPELRGPWDDSTSFLGDKQKWQAASAAVYLWLRLSDSERRRVAEKMYDADGKEGSRREMVKEVGGDPGEVNWASENDSVQTPPLLDASAPIKRKQRRR